MQYARAMDQAHQHSVDPSPDRQIDPQIDQRLDRLAAWFADCPDAVVAFSGGVDSSLVAFLAYRFLGPERSLSVISASASLKRSELVVAKAFCATHALPLRVIETRELSNPNYFLNPTNRCYYCKSSLYSELEPIARERSDVGEKGGTSWVLNGTNTDDHGDYRPGLIAAGEFQVRSPLGECGLDKAAVRALAAHFELDCHDKPASPCLASRIPYGQRVTPEKMRRIEDAEALLDQAGFPVARVRHHQDEQGPKARVEVPAARVSELQALEATLVPRLEALGFASVEFDPEGFVSGKLNRAVPALEMKKVVDLSLNPKAAS